MMNWRNVLLLGALITALPWLALAQARAQESYPSRPIRLVIPSVPGGVHEVIGRLWAERVKAILGTIVIDNRGGGGGVIGANDVAHSLPDGYSILLGSTFTQVLSPAAMAQPPYDPMMSFTGVSVFSFSSTSIVVNPTAPVHSLKELIAYAKANPGKLSYGSAGNGSITNMAGELFKRLGGGLYIRAHSLQGHRAGRHRSDQRDHPDVFGQRHGANPRSRPRRQGAHPGGQCGGADQGRAGRFRPPTKRACPAWWRRRPLRSSRRSARRLRSFRLDAATQKVMADEDFQKQLLNLGFQPVRGVGGERLPRCSGMSWCAGRRS